jgi:hypothetical protein
MNRAPDVKFNTACGWKSTCMWWEDVYSELGSLLCRRFQSVSDSGLIGEDSSDINHRLYKSTWGGNTRVKATQLLCKT